SDTNSIITTSRVEASSRREDPAPKVTAASGVSSRARGPYTAAIAFSIGRIDSGAAPPLPFVVRLPPTQAERDSIARDYDRRAAAAHDDHRPLAIPLGGSISLPMPFGGHVLSRA